MDFSKKYLLKYGWEEGQGLGKLEDGIKEAIKPKLKFDKAGMGYDPSVEFTDSWWVNVYNEALENVNVKKEGKELNETVENQCEKKTKTKKKKFTEESYIELFNACEGRTVHKGARQGLKLSGKLQRLQQQELNLFPKKENQKDTAKESNSLITNKDMNKPFVDEEIEGARKSKKRKRKHSSIT